MIDEDDARFCNLHCELAPCKVCEQDAVDYRKANETSATNNTDPQELRYY